MAIDITKLVTAIANGALASSVELLSVNQYKLITASSGLGTDLSIASMQRLITSPHTYRLLPVFYPLNKDNLPQCTLVYISS